MKKKTNKSISYIYKMRPNKKGKNCIRKITKQQFEDEMSIPTMKTIKDLEKRIKVLELLCDEHFNNKEPKVLGKELFDELYMPRTNVNRDGSLEELQEIKTYCRHTDYAVRGLYFDFNQIEKDLKAFEIINPLFRKIIREFFEVYALNNNHKREYRLEFRPRCMKGVYKVITKEEFDLLKKCLK